MSMWLEQKYIGLISNRLERFKRTKNNEYNFRCPLCGDSHKDKYKARGHLFVNKNGMYLFHCFNCSVTVGFDKFLENVDPIVHQEFVREKISENLNPSKRTKSPSEELAFKMKQPKFVKDSPLSKLKKISQLKWDHKAKKYIDSRKIPSTFHSKLFYAPKFKEWTNIVLPGKFDNLDYDDGRIIIPFIDNKGRLFGYQGRAVNPKAGIRYITIMIDKDMPKIFGIDTVDTTKHHYILEGPIDAMFVDNAIAMAGGSINMDYVNDKSIFVFDNEPRSVETCKKIEKVIDLGYKVVIFPENIKQKDINEMFLAGLPVQAILDSNVSNGLEAKIMFTAWKRI